VEALPFQHVSQGAFRKSAKIIPRNLLISGMRQSIGILGHSQPPNKHLPLRPRRRQMQELILVIPPKEGGTSSV